MFADSSSDGFIESDDLEYAYGRTQSEYQPSINRKKTLANQTNSGKIFASMDHEIKASEKMPINAECFREKNDSFLKKMINITKGVFFKVCRLFGKIIKNIL